jgi:hypothetical protein
MLSVHRGNPAERIGRSRVQGALRPPGGLLIRLERTIKVPRGSSEWVLPIRHDMRPGQTSDHGGFHLVICDDLAAPRVLLAA